MSWLDKLDRKFGSVGYSEPDVVYCYYHCGGFHW